MSRVLFVCAGNTCRSPMAAALARAQALDAESAGIESGNGLPAARHAVDVMRERGLDLSRHRSKDLEDTDVKTFDVLVAFSPAIARSLAALATKSPILVWDIADPYGGSVDQYRSVANAIEANLAQLLRESTA